MTEISAYAGLDTASIKINFTMANAYCQTDDINAIQLVFGGMFSGPFSKYTNCQYLAWGIFNDTIICNIKQSGFMGSFDTYEVEFQVMFVDRSTFQLKIGVNTVLYESGTLILRDIGERTPSVSLFYFSYDLAASGNAIDMSKVSLVTFLANANAGTVYLKTKDTGLTYTAWEPTNVNITAIAARAKIVQMRDFRPFTTSNIIPSAVRINIRKEGPVQVAYRTMMANQFMLTGCCMNAYEGNDDVSRLYKRTCSVIGMDQTGCDIYMDKRCSDPININRDECSCYNVDAGLAELPLPLRRFDPILRAQPKCWYTKCAANGYKNAQNRAITDCDLTMCSQLIQISGDNNILLNPTIQMTCKGVTANNGQVDNGDVDPDDPIIIGDVIDGGGNSIPLPDVNTSGNFFSNLTIFHWLLILLAVVVVGALLLQKKDPPNIPIPYNMQMYPSN